MVFSILRRVVRSLPTSIPLICVFAAIIAFWSQNHTTVRRGEDFFVLTSDDVCERFPRRLPDHESRAEPGIECPEELPPAQTLSDTASVAVARKYLMTRRVGFQAFGRGHSIVHAAEFPEFDEAAPFLKRINAHLKRHYIEAGREFTEMDWSSVLDGFRDPTFSQLNWEGETKIDLLFVSSEAVSFAEYRHEYTGGAHGNHWVSGQNFVADQDSFRQLVLNDLFEQETDWLRALLRVCLTDLHRQGASRVGESSLDDPIESGFTLDDVQSFTLSPDGMRFYFSPYHMGCYAEGFYSVNVPYSAMMGFIPANSPLHRFMKVSRPTAKGA